jgi:hypothetical protein
MAPPDNRAAASFIKPKRKGSRPIKPMIGRKFHRLTVIGHAGDFIARDKSFRIQYQCRCACGTLVTAQGINLRNGNTKSCGCLKLEMLAKRSTKHGHCRRSGKATRAWIAWQAMKGRTRYAHQDPGGYYFKKGIRVCKRWLASFANFLKDMGEPARGMTLDRINNAKGYSPSNCRWADRHTQSENRSMAIMVAHNGENRCVTAWCRILKLRPSSIYRRIKRGLTPKEALYL